MYKPGDYNCQMNELMFQAGPRCKRNERAKRAHSLYIMNSYMCYIATGTYTIVKVIMNY